MSARPVRTLAVALAVLVLGAGTAAAQKSKGAKAASACGLKQLPLTVGNTWTYEPIPLPPELMPAESQARFLPPQAKKVVITVAGIDPAKDGKTTVHLSEDTDGRKVDTTLVCGAGVFEVDPESIFFTGEPGGSYGTTLTKIDRKLVEGVGLGAPWSNLWREDVVVEFTRTAADGITADLGKGKFEYERRITFGGPETVDVPYKAQLSARRMTIEITGRVLLDGAAKPSELQANWNNALWFSDGLGLVQVQNSSYQKFGLVSAALVK